MAGSKSKECTCQKDHGGYWLGTCESTFKECINKVSSLDNLKFSYGFIFLKDPTSPLTREEQQKKAWQAQSNKNILVKKTMEAIFPYVSQHFFFDYYTFSQI